MIAISEPPISDEPEINPYREAALRMFALLDPCIAHILAAKSAPVGRAQIKFALNLEPRSMHEVAAQLGVTPQCLSRGMKEFIRDNNLPQPLCAKSPEASVAYRDARNRQLKAHP